MRNLTNACVLGRHRLPLRNSEETDIVETAKEDALRCYYDPSQKCKDLSSIIESRIFNRKQRLDQYCQQLNLYQHNNFQQLPKHAFVYDQEKSLLGLGFHKLYILVSLRNLLLPIHHPNDFPKYHSWML